MLKRYFNINILFLLVFLLPSSVFALSFNSNSVTIKQHAAEVPLQTPVNSNTVTQQRKIPRYQRDMMRSAYVPTASTPKYIYEAQSRSLTQSAPLHQDIAEKQNIQYYDYKSAVYDRNGTPAFERSDLYFGLFTGYQSSSLNWHIGIPDTGPNILSELTWRDIQSIIYGGNIEYKCKTNWCRNGMLFSSFYSSHAFSGDNQDSDFNQDNRVDEFSRSNNNADGSRTQGFSIALGYDFALDYDHIGFSLIPKLGYSYDAQIMKMTDGNQTIPAAGPFPNLNSRYETQWSGGFAGLEGRIKFYKDHELRVSGSYAKVNYDAGARWNLRADFAQPTSFEHSANGFGHTLALGYSYRFLPEWELKLDGKYEFWKTDPGHDITFFSDGSTGSTRLNEVKYKSHSYTAGVSYHF